jgi:hypothetical protein
MFNSPESLSFDGMAAIALVAEEFAIGADQSAGGQGLGYSHHKDVKNSDKYNRSLKMLNLEND